MRKIAIASLAVASALTLAGCGSSDTTAPVAQTPAANQTTQAPAVTTPAATVVTAATIEAQLKAAGMTFTQKDKTAAAQAMKNGSGISKSTEFKVTVPGDTVVLSVNELSDPAQKVAVESDIRMSWIPLMDTEYKAVMAKMNTQSALVGVIYKNAVEKDAWKVMDAIGAE